MIEIIEAILNKMVKICKPLKKFVIGELIARLSSRGKMNFRNMSRYSNFTEKTFARNYEKSFNFAEFNQQALSLILQPDNQLIAAFDPSFVKKSGEKTFGKDYFWNGSANRAEKGLEVGLLAVVDVSYGTAYPISAQQTPPIAASRKKKDMAITEESRIDAYLKHLDRDKGNLPSQVKHMAVDAFFTKKKFVAGVMDMGLHVIGKLRQDANLRHLYSGKQLSRGRPKKYAGKVNVADLSQLEFFGEAQINKNQKGKLYTAVVNSVSLKRDIRIVLVLSNGGKGKNARSLLFSTDLNLSALDIHRFYGARYQIEFVFREAKQHTGLSECQARSGKKLHWHFNASFAALNVTKIYDRINKKDVKGRGTFSMASWKTRFYIKSFIDRFFSKSETGPTSIKFNSCFEALSNYGVISYGN